MPVSVSQTPNPNALKFTVGAEFDTPKSFAAGQSTDDPVAGPIIAIDGVTSVFMSADFVTVSKSADAFWDTIVPAVTEILEEHYG
ncbi:MAG TPA: NifU N-terminal domain-containing protein [Acidimicrobiia bacterium]|nr:NifU N-terminal domain-containing protein [Acidimicrobiia bacterium]